MLDQVRIHGKWRPIARVVLYPGFIADRMAFLLRREEGRRRVPELLVRLSELLGREITSAEVLPLERGDALWEVARPSMSRACCTSRFQLWVSARCEFARVRSRAGSVHSRRNRQRSAR